MSPSSQRAQPRVKYPADVRLFAGSRDPLAGRSRDLGPAGIYVEAGERLAVGTTVVCEMALPSGPVRLQGVVAREQALAREVGRVGLGIRFVDLDDGARSQLEGLIPADERAGQLMAIHLDGVKEALRSQAAVTDNGVSVTTTLPFLREGTEVKVAFLAGASRIESRGVVRGVNLAAPAEDGSPRVELQLQFLPASAAKVHIVGAREAHGSYTTRTDAAQPADDDDQEHEEVTEVTAVETPSGRGVGTLQDILARDRALTQRLRRGSRQKRGVAATSAAPARAARAAAVLAACLFLMAAGAALNRFGLHWNARNTPAPADPHTVVVSVPTAPAPVAPSVPAVPVPSGATAPAPVATSAPTVPVPSGATAPTEPSALVEASPRTAAPAPSGALPAPTPAPGAEPAPKVASVRAGEPAAAAPVAAQAGRATPPASPPVESAATPAAAAAAGITTLPVGTPGPEVISKAEEIEAIVPRARLDRRRGPLQLDPAARAGRGSTQRRRRADPGSPRGFQ